MRELKYFIAYKVIRMYSKYKLIYG